MPVFGGTHLAHNVLVPTIATAASHTTRLYLLLGDKDFKMDDHKQVARPSYIEGKIPKYIFEKHAKNMGAEMYLTGPFLDLNLR